MPRRDSLRLLGTVLQLARSRCNDAPWGGFRRYAAAAEQQGTCQQVNEPGSLLQQRYAGMLQSGVLKPDQQQQQLVQQLSLLLVQLQSYSGHIASYRAAKADYEARYHQRLEQLKAADDTQEQQQQKALQQPPQPSLFESWLHTAGFSKPQPPGPTPQQRARQAAAARAAAVRQELGPAPTPPPAPQGLYVYGNVGSGKSLLMDMFYDIVVKHVQLDHSRRLHFNAAMLELHSRLHHLDTQQQRRRDETTAAAAGAATPQPPNATATAGAVFKLPTGTTKIGSRSDSGTSDEVPVGVVELLHDGPSLQVEQGAAAGLDHAVDGDAAATAAAADDDGSSDIVVSRWFDDGVLRQKQAKAAILAIRRHLRSARAGRVSSDQLAAANASVMTAAARSFMRGSSNTSQGWNSNSSSERVAGLLCFDELQISDVWSAAALKALLECLTAEGCVIVTTSNRHPAELPRHGLHEAMFGHFLNTLFSSCRLFELSSPEDYRRLALTAPTTKLLQQPMLPSDSSSNTTTTSSSSSAELDSQRSYFWPLSPAAEAALHRKWTATVLNMPVNSQRSSSSSSSSSCMQQPAQFGSSTSAAALMHSSSASSTAASATTVAAAAIVPVMFGRQLHVSRCASGAAWFNFSELCGQPLGAADYLALAQHFHTVFISGIPAMSMNIRDQARRFITLVDELYNARVLLVCTAALPPDQLFTGAEGEEPIIDLEGLQFEGAVEGSKLRRNLMADGSVAPVAATATAITEATALLGGMEERFAFRRAVSRLYEMQSPLYAAAQSRAGSPDHS